MKRLLFVCLVFAISAALIGQEENFLWDMENKIQHERAHHHQTINFKANPLTQNYDLKYHRLVWEVDPAVLYISGAITSYFVPTSDGFNQINFDLEDNMTVDSVLYHGSPVSFTLSIDNLQIDLMNVIPIGTLDSLTIVYQGEPIKSGFSSFDTSSHEGVPVLWTLSEPYGAKTWWPCKQDLIDKIDSIDIIVTTPEQYRVGSNGVLKSEVNTRTGFITYHWQHRYPIPAYLISLAITNYASVTDYVYTDNGDSILILNYVYPEDLPSVQSELGAIIEQMELFNKLFGLYPFADEKYGHAQCGFGGGMEHQTMSSMGGFDYYLQAHELAHQWFGDKITCGSWQDIWLNEGFATYLTVLTDELLTPHDDWKNRIKWYINFVTDKPGGSTWVEDTTDVYRIFDYRLTYIKGALILHMLRWELGDDDFFQGVRNYINDPKLAYGYSTIDELKHHLESIKSIDLTEFFDDWYYGQGFPSYSIQYTPNSEGVEVIIHQVTSHPSVDFFEMPLPLKISDGVHDTLVVVNHTFSGQKFDLLLPFEPTWMEFDPDLWIISRNNTVELITNTDDWELSGVSIYPNPATQFVTISIDNPDHLDKISSMIITDSKGALIRKIEQIEAKTDIDLSGYPTGTYFINILTNSGNFVRKFTKI
jgi:aminopeptidase N